MRNSTEENKALAHSYEQMEGGTLDSRKAAEECSPRAQAVGRKLQTLSPVGAKEHAVGRAVQSNVCRER